MMFPFIAEIMMFVPDRRVAAEWYARLFDCPLVFLDNPEHFFVRIGACDLWFHAADEKMGPGIVGQVAYWRVESLDHAMDRAREMGAVLFRGPLDREDGEFMCQMIDPFGNVLGLIGRSTRLTGDKEGGDGSS